MPFQSSVMPGELPVAIGIMVAAASLAAGYLWLRRGLDNDSYHPPLAWLRAGLFFCAALAAGIESGALPVVLSQPVATPGQLADPLWWTATVGYLLFVIVAYGVIWPRGTFTDDRQLHALLAPAFGLVWGLCQGLVFLSIWAVIARTGLGVWAVAGLSYLAIAVYNGLLHSQFWDIHVSPPHNYREWNIRKIVWCHTPNLLIGLAYLAWGGNAAVFVLLQGLALAASARAMHFPVPWDQYLAEPGLQRSLADRA